MMLRNTRKRVFYWRHQCRWMTFWKIRKENGDQAKLKPGSCESSSTVSRLQVPLESLKIERVCQDSFCSLKRVTINKLKRVSRASRECEN